LLDSSDSIAYNDCTAIELENAVANITIRNLPDEIKSALRVSAARNDRSMEEEAREILRRAVMPDTTPAYGLGSRIAARFSMEKGTELALPDRHPQRVPPDFS
jgi:plasmid stability protein